jgi:hypothetical protein
VSENTDEQIAAFQDQIRKLQRTQNTIGRFSVDAETLVKAIAIRLETESAFLSPQPVTYVTNPREILKLAEDAGASSEQIDQWIEEALIQKPDWPPVAPEPESDFSQQTEEALTD